MASPPATRKRILYSGDVQGVGFRQRSAWIARRHGLVGYVRNLADGRVELVAEATPERIKDMMKEVAASFRDNISDCVAEDVPATEPLAGFDIRY